MTGHDYDQWAEASLTRNSQLAATLPVLARESTQLASDLIIVDLETWIHVNTRTFPDLSPDQENPS